MEKMIHVESEQQILRVVTVHRFPVQTMTSGFWQHWCFCNIGDRRSTSSSHVSNLAIITSFVFRMYILTERATCVRGSGLLRNEKLNCDTRHKIINTRRRIQARCERNQICIYFAATTETRARSRNYPRLFTYEQRSSRKQNSFFF